MHLVEERMAATDLRFPSRFGVVLRGQIEIEGKCTAVAGLNSGLILYSDPVFNNRPFFRAFCNA